jgi:hypothetical protein
MSDFVNIKSDAGGQKFYGISRPQQKQEEAQKQQQLAQDPSTVTGLQWAQTQAVQQSQAGQASAQANNGAKPVETKGSNAGANNFALVQPNMEDVAMLSSTVTTRADQVDAPKQGLVTRFLADRINMNALESTFKEYYKKSKSHNLLLERFMSNIKFSAIKSMMTMMGVSGEEQVKIQSEVRGEALNEIDSKLKNDWAYTKAMMDITQG